jgi:hypothetical protein
VKSKCAKRKGIHESNVPGSIEKKKKVMKEINCREKWMQRFIGQDTHA